MKLVSHFLQRVWYKFLRTMRYSYAGVLETRNCVLFFTKLINDNIWEIFDRGVALSFLFVVLYSGPASVSVSNSSTTIARFEL